jgi:hypothetical protein
LTFASRPKSELPSVVHLVRHGTPLGSLEQFLDSYRRHDAGVDHRLVLLCKGFGSPDELRPVLARLDGLRAERIDVPDDGYDLTAYRRAAERLGDGVACYLNSNSVLLCDGWLAPLLSALTPEVGIAGATGSWHSAHSNALYLLRLPSAYTPVFPDRAWHRTQSRRLHADGTTGAAAGAMAHPPLRYLHTAYAVSRSLALFGPFPASHIRTNAFVIRNETMRRLHFWPLRNKLRAWQLESGRGSITEQIRVQGLEALVVGRTGRGYAPGEWADSDTLCQADQDNLLVADNQTEVYRRADLELRTLLSKAAWGLAARPAPPAPPA